MDTGGIPDIIICLCGRFVAIELKAGDNVPTERQLMTMQLINKAKGLAVPCWSLEAVQEALTPILKEYYNK